MRGWEDVPGGVPCGPEPAPLTAWHGRSRLPSRRRPIPTTPPLPRAPVAVVTPVSFCQYLRMMGVHPTTSFLAWFVENVAVLTAGSAALAAVLRASGIFAHSDAFLVFLFLLDFAVSVAMLSYLLSACFSHANTAALCASLLYMVSFLPYVVLLVLRHQLSVAAQTLLVSASSAR